MQEMGVNKINENKLKNVSKYGQKLGNVKTDFILYKTSVING